MGDHQVGCSRNNDRNARHNFICDSILSAARAAALARRREVPSPISGTRSRPADIFLPNLSGGQPAALDITVISPMQSLNLEECRLKAGANGAVGPVLTGPLFGLGSRPLFGLGSRPLLASGPLFGL